jgi:hypothetical protein
MAQTLYDIIEWSKANGEVKVIERIQMRILSNLINENIRLKEVTPSTVCSSELLAKVRAAASEVIGKACP